jgi:hypothetical protein
MLNTGVESLKIDAKTLQVTGTIDSNGRNDDIVYDHVVIAAEVGGNILNTLIVFISLF